jgi:DNA polymerase-3 subunit beta
VKLTCKQQDLSRGLSVVGHAVSSRSTLPILSNILLTTDNGRLKLSATNLEIGINCWIDAQILEEGSTTTPAKLLTDLINSLPQSQLELTSGDDYTLNIKGMRSSANINGMDPSEYPLIPSAEGGELPVSIDAALLKEVINEVAFAAAEDDSRPVLTGVQVEIGNEKATFASADAFRLAIRVIDLPGHEQAHDNILIPARTLEELARILPNEGIVQMIVTPNRSQVLFHSDQIDLVSRLIEGTYPNVRAIIPKGYTTRAVVETREFAAAVKSVAPFARDSSNITRIKLSNEEDQEQGSMTLEATAESVGNNVSTINATIDGPEQQIIFNVKYLSDILSVVGTPEVAVELSSDSRPGVIRPVSQADYTYVIMPMKGNH